MVAATRYLRSAAEDKDLWGGQGSVVSGQWSVVDGQGVKREKRSKLKLEL